MGKKVYIGKTNKHTIMIICLYDVINPVSNKMSIDEYVIILKNNLYIKKYYSHSKGENFFIHINSRNPFYEAPYFYFKHIASLAEELFENVRGIIYSSKNVTERATQCFYNETDETLNLYWKQWIPKYKGWVINNDGCRNSKIFRYHTNTNSNKDNCVNNDTSPLAIQTFDVIDGYLLGTLLKYFELYNNLLGLLT